MNVFIKCGECGKRICVVGSQYRYQTNKNPNRKWFCGRPCSARYRNSVHVSSAAHLHSNQRQNSLKGATKNIKYDQQFVWYTSRCVHDHRQKNRPSDIQAFEAALRSAWLNQSGSCAITGIPLKLRNKFGKCETDDTWQIASIDRRDSKLPYQPDNLQWVSVAINLAKSDTPQQKFLAGFAAAARNFLTLVEARGH